VLAPDKIRVPVRLPQPHQLARQQGLPDGVYQSHGDHSDHVFIFLRYPRHQVYLLATTHHDNPPLAFIDDINHRGQIHSPLIVSAIDHGWWLPLHRTRPVSSSARQ